MNIYVDYDTTLVNLIDPWVQWINKKYDVSLQTTDINRWYFLSDVFGREANDFWKSEHYNHYIDRDIYKPYIGAKDFFRTLQSKFGKDSIFIISSSRDHHITEKIKHATHHFGIDKSNFIPVNNQKYGLTKNGILIDDYPLHIFEHIHHNNNYGIVFNLDNRFGWARKCNYQLDPTLDEYINIAQDEKFFVATSYDQIISQIDNIQKKDS